MTEETFIVKLRVTARPLTEEEYAEAGFPELDDEPYEADDEPVDVDAIAECIANSFHEDAISEMLAGSNLAATITAVTLESVEP